MMSLSLSSRLIPRLRPFRALSNSAYRISAFGDASSVLSLESAATPPTATANNLVVKWLAAGVDPVDLAALRGESSASAFAPPSLPAVPGNEGVAVVQEAGPDVQTVKNGDYVIPIKTAVGTWCENGIVNESQVIPVPATLRMELAATLSSSPFTALRLLSDFGSLSPGDVVVQNDASSPIGTAVVQIAHSLGLKTVSFVNESAEDYAPTVERLKIMGGDVVVAEEFVESDGFKKVMADFPVPRLGINTAGAQSCAILASLVGEEGTVVTTCPGVADEPAIKSRGLSHASFSLPAWLENSSRADVEGMVTELVDMIEQGKLTAWLQRVKFEQLSIAIDECGMTRRKLVALMPAADSL